MSYQEKRNESLEGISTTTFIILLVAVLSIGALWMTVVRFDVMKITPIQEQSKTTP